LQNRTATPILALLITVLLIHSGAGAEEPSVDRLPNVLLILADDLGYGDVGCYNPESKVPTPHLDQLAREGIRFTDAHSPSTVCTPTRYSILTGQMAFRINYRGVFVGVGGPCLIGENQLTLGQLLRDCGYKTGMVGKWHIGLTFLDQAGKRITKGGVEGVKLVDYTRAIPDAPIHRGFDYFFGTACCPTTDFLYAFIDGDRIPVPPTQLLDRSTLPKHPYAFDNRLGMVAPDFDLENIDLKFLDKSREFLAQHVQSSPDKPFFLFHSMQAVHLPSFPAPQFQGKSGAGPHGDFIYEMDHVVGQLLQTLDELGVADDTLVIFTSDNGPETTSVVHMRTDHQHDGARPWRGLKRDQWEGGHRVPFIARWPGKIAPAGTSDQTMCLTDLLATCAALTGRKLPPNTAEDSVNMLPALLEKDAGKPLREYTLHQTISLALAVRKGPWKYLDHRGSGGNNYRRGPLKAYALPDTAPDAPGQLYHLGTDPGETTNLYHERPSIVQELKALLEKSKRDGRSAPALHRTGKYQQRTIADWQVLVSERLLDQNAADTNRALDLLTSQLKEIIRVVPPAALAKLQKVPLWISPRYPDKGPTAEYHPHVGWLRKHGRKPEMAKCVEFSNVLVFEEETDRMPNFVLHELAHAYHDRVLEGGFANTEIRAAYEKAKASGTYEKVERWHGNGKANTFERAYAMSTPMEYFAECSEAYFGRNDFFPFTKKELQRHDPSMYDLLTKLWGMPTPQEN
jgi:arylsulfatase A-like enzyme